MATRTPWWRTAVIYQIYPKSWADSDGDGVGDVAGIRARLGHLARLGVDAVWFSPWYPSAQVDGGYDISDHRGIDPQFGDLGQVEGLIGEAHDLGLRVIVDLVPNHTSDQHRFFQEAIASPPGSPAWQRYHCVRSTGADPPNGWLSVFGGSAWEPVPQQSDQSRAAAGPEQAGRHWYLHLFDVRQPDLNWDHPDVRAEFELTLRFWLDRGVDGFRIDVAHGLVKAAGYPDRMPAQADPSQEGADRPGEPQWDQPGVHEIWRQWRRIADTYQPERAFVGEVWVGSPERLGSYLRPDELHSAFNFDFLRCPWDPRAMREVIQSSIRVSTAVGAAPTWVLENHDVPRVRSRYGLLAAGALLPEHNVGRLPSVTPDDRVGLARARAALLLMLGLPGSAYLYQGQELGLPEVVEIPAALRRDPAFARTNGTDGYRDGCRVPMPWTRRGASFGFSPTGRTWLPQPDTWGELSVQAQTGDPRSMLELTRAALRLRREADLGQPGMDWMSDPDSACLVVRRPGGDPVPVLVAINMGTRDVAVPGGQLLLGSDPRIRHTDAGWLLPPDCAAWLCAP